MTYALFWLVLVSGAAGLCLVAIRRLGASPWGRALRAVRDDQVVAAVAGKPVSVAATTPYGCSIKY